MPARKRKSHIHKLLVANRGEIAARILRTCREMRLPTVAVYSDVDRNAPYLELADETVHIGAGPASESYLRAEHIFSAAKSTRADAIHPGYGFLSENADFAARCEERGITFVGPCAAVIRALGDKAGAKALAAKAGVPVVPGYYGADQTDERLAKEAVSLGVPLLIKATAGGGGRGMRLVLDMDDFPSMLREARREGLAAFGNDAVLLERYIACPRHVEVQIVGDAKGQVHALHERECSIQRRHQKILEESPSPGITDALRDRIVASAVLLGQAAAYKNAGTVEFLVDSNGTLGEFYFLEVNTRLQVEHPVTELRTGLDLVRLQIEIASGMPTPQLDAEAPAIGHAIEVRVCSEDPAHSFAPSVGTLLQWIEPTGPGIRVDAGVARGSEVSPYYDPLLAKLIVHAPTRAEAIARLERALMDFHVLGVESNIAYLLSIVRDPRFQAGETHVRFLDDHFSDWRPEQDLPDEVLLALAAEALRSSVLTGGQPGPASNGTSQSQAASVWAQVGGWRNA